MPVLIRRIVVGLFLFGAFASASLAVDATYSYDAMGRLVSVTYACGASTSFVYDAAGNRSSTSSVAGCPPVAVNDTMTTAFNTAANFDPRSNDSDPNGYSLTIAGAGTPAHGGAVVNSGTSITYTPTTGYSGADSFTYTISDGHGLTATATVSVTVSPGGNQPPVANNDTLTTTTGIGGIRRAFLNPTVNDTDADGDALTVTAVTNGANGTCAISLSGSRVTYTANSGFTGSDSCVYTIFDGHSHTASATISVTVPP